MIINQKTKEKLEVFFINNLLQNWTRTRSSNLWLKKKLIKNLNFTNYNKALEDVSTLLHLIIKLKEKKRC